MVTSKSKWKKYLTLKKNKEVARHLPKTIRFSLEEKLWNFVEKYHAVIIKPCLGSRGKNILKITALESDKFKIHYLNRKQEFIGKDSAYAYLQKTKAPTPYIVQRYIPLANIQGHPFDIRVIVQKQKNTNEWVVTGKVAKLAGKGFFVTNNKLSGGTALPVAEAIEASNIHKSYKNSEKLVSELERIALLATKTLEERNQGRHIYGFDMGIDSDGHIWIIEANLKPMLSHFFKLQDKTMYHTIKELREFHEGK
jgi:glutathione synthase/RimK-type ligase-like ATP-grasp enzyme